MPTTPIQPPVVTRTTTGEFIRAYARRQWRRRAVKAAAALLAGSLLGAACAYAPESLKEPCHMAARLCSILLGAG